MLYARNAYFIINHKEFSSMRCKRLEQGLSLRFYTHMWDKASTYLYAVQYVAIDYYFLFTIYPTL